MYLTLRNNESIFIESADNFVEIKSDGFGRIAMKYHNISKKKSLEKESNK